jgi:hypothetical protein
MTIGLATRVKARLGLLMEQARAAAARDGIRITWRIVLSPQAQLRNLRQLLSGCQPGTYIQSWR